MAWNIAERFPSWGETGEFPAAGFFYEGGDQVNEKHLDALWNGINGLEEDIQAALADIDSDADGVVDKADTLASAATLDGDLSAADGETIWDESAGYIPQGRLQNDSVTVNSGTGLTGGATIALGGSTTLTINPADFAANGLKEDANNNMAIEPADFAGTNLQDGGNDSLEVVQGSGSGLDADTVDGIEGGDIPSAGIRFIDQARNFDGSDGENVSLNATKITPDGSIQLFNANGIFVDDFEDGDISGWSGATGNLSAQQNTVLAGDYTGRFYDNSGNYTTVDSPSVGSSTEDVELYWKHTDEYSTGSSSDKVEPKFLTSGGTEIGRLIGYDYDPSFDSDIIWSGSSDTQVLSNGKNDIVRIVMQWDFANNQVTIKADRDDTGVYDNTVTVGFANGASSWDYIQIGIKNTNYFFDHQPSTTSGSATISWPYPTDLYSWNITTFQRTLNSETVTVDIEDGNGNTLKSNISRNTDISDISSGTNVHIKANISRSSTSNDPSFDYAARKYSR